MVCQTKPAVWVLADDRPGNNSQSIGLAEALGGRYEVKPFQFYRFARFLARLPNWFLGMSRCDIRAVDSETKWGAYACCLPGSPGRA